MQVKRSYAIFPTGFAVGKRGFGRGCCGGGEGQDLEVAGLRVVYALWTCSNVLSSSG
jgi:hypothetical protein